MRILTGDECGLLKEYLPSQVKAPSKDAADPTATVVVTSDGIRRINNAEQMARRNAVVGLTWMPEHHHFAALRVDGTVQVWEGTYEAHQAGAYRPNVEIARVFSSSTADDNTNNRQSDDDVENETASSASSDDVNNNPPRAIGIHSWSSHNRLVACNTAGTIAVIDPFAQEQENCVVKKFETFASSSSSIETTKQQREEQSSSRSSTIQTTAFALNPEDGIAAVGAKDRETVLWDVNTGTQVWKAKNLPPDPQTLLQPRVWPTTACFFPDNRNLLAVGSAYHQVRIYDVRMPSSSSSSDGGAGTIKMQRRPIQYTDEKNTYLEHRITALCPLPSSSHEIVVGDAGGYLQSLDRRQLTGGANVQRNRATPVLGRFVGPAGSVRQLALYNNNNNNDNNNQQQQRLVCVGLDRMLRIYDVRSRRQLQTVYLKQRLNCVLVSDEALVEDDNDNDDDDDVDDSDIDQEDNVQDYVDSDNEGNSNEDDDDVVETIDGMPQGSSSESEDDDNNGDEDASSSEDGAGGGGDSNDDASSEEAETSPRKRRRR